MKRVRLIQPSEVPASAPVGRVWLPIGAECDLPDELFDPSVHVDITPTPTPEPAPAPAPAPVTS